MQRAINIVAVLFGNMSADLKNSWISTFRWRRDTIFIELLVYARHCARFFIYII
jgi:hypothetical protein